MVQTNGTKAETGAGSQTRASGPLASGAGAGALIDASGEGEEGGGGTLLPRHPAAALEVIPEVMPDDTVPCLFCPHPPGRRAESKGL